MGSEGFTALSSVGRADCLFKLQLLDQFCLKWLAHLQESQASYGATRCAYVKELQTASSCEFRSSSSCELRCRARAPRAHLAMRCITSSTPPGAFKAMPRSH